MNSWLSRFRAFLLRLLEFVTSVVLVAVLMLFAAWKVLDARCLHTHQFMGKGTPIADQKQTIIQQNLATTINNLAQTDGGERNVYRPEKLARAGSWITGQFETNGYKNVTHLPFSVPTYYKFDATSFTNLAANIVAEKVGTSNSKEIILIGAHYDTGGFPNSGPGMTRTTFG